MDFVGPLLEWLNAHPQLAGLVTFLISAGESVAIIGTIVPGSVTMTAIGALAGAGIIPLWETIIWAILGAIVGDGISYWMGYYFKDRIKQYWPFRTNPSLIRTGEIFIQKHGVMSVFIGRFVGPVRALVPLVAGMLGMEPLRFLIANVLSAIGWAPAYMLPGILLGAAALELPPDIAIHVMMVLILATLFFILCIWLVFKTLSLIHTQVDQWQNSIWQRLKTSTYFHGVTHLLKHYDAKKPHGQLTSAFYLLFLTALLVGLVFYVHAKGSSTIMFNDALFHLFRGIRHEKADTYMLFMTLLGQKEVILPVIALLFAWLLYAKRFRAAFHIAALAVLATAAVFLTKHCIQVQRPVGLLHAIDSYSMPSGHTTLATTVFIGFAYLLAASCKPSLRWFIYFIAGVIVVAVGISRMYLGAHWFTDVLAGILLGAIVLISVMISYEHKAEKPVSPWKLLSLTGMSLALSLTIYSYLTLDTLKTRYEQMPWPTVTIAMQSWWQHNDAMPAYHVSLFGFPSTPINIEWAGEITKIKETLVREGWSNPPARDLISTLHRLADIRSSQYLPMVSPQYLDKTPALILTRTIVAKDGRKKLLVLRLWNSNRMIKEATVPVWVGVVAVAPRSYSWLFKNREEHTPLDPKLIFPNKATIANWQWKILPMDLSTGTKKIISQDILLIRTNKLNHRK